MAHLFTIGRRADPGEPIETGQTIFATGGNHIRLILSLGMRLGVPVVAITLFAKRLDAG